MARILGKREGLSKPVEKSKESKKGKGSSSKQLSSNRSDKLYSFNRKEWKKDKNYLVIVDVSSVMRTSNHSPFSKDMSYVVNGEEMLTGAMYGLFQKFSRFGFSDNVDYIFCFDSVNGLLKQIDKNYKADRVKVANTYFSQINTMYKLLEEVGYKVMLHSGSIKTNLGNFKNAGIEADHCIAMAVEQNYDYFDEIAIITGDHDISHLIDDKVFIVNPIKSRGDTTKENYEERLKCPYNSILLKKATVGDKSDNIKGIIRFGEQAFINFMKEQIPDGIDNVRGHEEDIIRQSDLDDRKKGEALYSLKLVLPFEEFSIYDEGTGNYVEIDATSLPSTEVDYSLLSLYLEKYGMSSVLKLLKKEGKIKN